MTRTRYKHLLMIAFDYGFATKHEPFLLTSQVAEAITGEALMTPAEIEMLLDTWPTHSRAMRNAIGDAYIAGRWGGYEQIN